VLSEIVFGTTTCPKEGYIKRNGKQNSKDLFCIALGLQYLCRKKSTP